MQNIQNKSSYTINHYIFKILKTEKLKKCMKINLKSLFGIYIYSKTKMVARGQTPIQGQKKTYFGSPGNQNL